MKLELIESIAPADWDAAIAGFDSAVIFHQSAWLAFLDATQPGHTLCFRLLDRVRTLLPTVARALLRWLHPESYNRLMMTDASLTAQVPGAFSRLNAL